MSEQNKILSVENLRISFGDENPFVAVDDVSFELEKGKTLAIVGESGSGKSLTALSLIGLLPKTAKVSGVVNIYDKEKFDLYNANTFPVQLRGDTVGMVFQEPMSSLNPVMKVGEQVMETILLHQNISKKAARKEVISWFDKVKLPEPEKIFSRYPHQLSGGQKQRVMIAMAMCNHPTLLIADEPTTALDVTVQKEIVLLMKQLQGREGIAMIFITHDLALAGDIADEMLVMYQGEVVEKGSAKQVLSNPQHNYTKALVACRPSPEHKNKKLPVIADFLHSEKMFVAELHQKTETNETLLKVDNLKVWFTVQQSFFGKPELYFKAVDGVSFDLRKGEVLGLVGESGCGKSTISRSLMGLLPTHEGQIKFQGKDLANLPGKEWQKIRRQIQLIFQDPYASLNPRMSIGDMLTEVLAVHNIVPRSERRKEARRLMELVQLPADSLKRYPHQFSGGQRQRIGIARALAVRPQLLICDESVSALDVSVQAQILNLLKELQTEFDLSYLFISHDLNVVHYISDRVLVMQNGKFVERGKAEDVLRHPEYEYTKKLVAAVP